MIVEIITLIFLIGIAVMDWKYKQIPAIFTTAWIFILLVVNSQNILYGILAFAFAFFLWELDHDGKRYISGVADFKVIMIIGLMISNILNFGFFMIGTTAISIPYVLLYERLHKKEKDIPFIPVLAFVYALMLFSGLII